MKCTKNKEETTTFGTVKDKEALVYDVEQAPMDLLSSRVSSANLWGKDLKDIGNIRFSNDTALTYTTSNRSLPTGFGKSVFTDVDTYRWAFDTPIVNPSRKPKICTHVPARGFRPHITINCSECQKEKAIELATELKVKNEMDVLVKREGYKKWTCYHMLDDDNNQIKFCCDICKCKN